MLLDLVLAVTREPLVPSLVGLVTALLWYYIVYPLYFAPLSRIPGPKISALTSYWILYQTWNEKRIRLTHKLHERYGGVVRLGPNEVSISDPELLKPVYIGNYDKSPFYGQFGAYGQFNTFSSLTKDAHLKRRKHLTRLYSKTTIASRPVESMTQKRIDDTMKIIRANGGNTLDVYNTFHALAMDTVTGFILGPDDGTNFLVTQDYTMIEYYRLQSAMWFWTTLMPRFYDMALDKSTKDAVTTIASWCKTITLRKVDDPALGTVVDQLKKSGRTDLEACSESQDHTAAGHETTGVTLSYLIYHLSQHPELQDKLFLELDNAFGGKLEEQVPFNEVDELPYLNGVLMETLRLYSAIPGAEPRIVPAQGLVTKAGFIPPGTIISMQPWTMHRDPEAFPEPEKFDPGRWYESDAEQLRKMNRNFTAFGAGVRMCIGMNLAMQEMKLITANIYREFSTSMSPGFDAESEMLIMDKYTTHPRGHSCPIIFKKRNL